MKKRKRRRKKMLISNNSINIHLYQKYGTARVRIATKEEQENTAFGLISHFLNGESVMYISDPSGDLLKEAIETDTPNLPEGYQMVGY